MRFEVDEDRPDAPVVAPEVDGKNPFESVAQGWLGFDPVEMFGPEQQLLPIHIGRRVALYRGSCGEPWCGVIAPYVARSADGRRVSWSDFRDYVGVFSGPVRDDVPAEGGNGR